MPLKFEFDKFKKVSTDILTSKQLSDPNWRATLYNKLIKTHNNVIQYIGNIYDTATPVDKLVCDQTYSRVRELLIRCLDTLGVTYDLPDSKSVLSSTHIEPLTSISGTSEPLASISGTTEPLASPSGTSATIASLTLATLTDSSSDSEEDQERNNNRLNQSEFHEVSETIEEHHNDRFNLSEFQEEPETIAMDTPSFLKLCAATINKNYSGDPLGLRSFIDSIDLLDSIAETNALKQMLFTFIKTKLDGRAREFVLETVTTINQLKNALTDNIKPDNSKIVEGRMMTLKLHMHQSEQFANKVEELSDALRRTLIIEGVGPMKANEIAIEKTVEVCRKNTQSPLIKSVLEASKFEQPKDVVSKLITQIDKTKAEVTILSVQANGNSQNRRGRGNFRRDNNNRGRFNNRYQSNNQNYNQNYNRNKPNQSRGRGQNRGGRGNYSNYNRQYGYSNGYNQNYRGNYSNNQHPQIRSFAHQGNGYTTHGQGQIMGPAPQMSPHYNSHPIITTPSEI